MPLIEGLDDSILVFILIALTNAFFALYFGIVLFRANYLRNDAGANAREGTPQPPRPHNPGMCPICHGEPQTLAVETNCAHLFCGDCLRTLWERMGNRGSFLCPMCRTLVSLLFDVFATEELNDASIEAPREEIVQFVRLYNYKQNMSGAYALLDRIQQVPVLLRHLFTEIMNGQLDSYLICRMVVSFSLFFFYFVLQTDMIPESFFGLLGLFDDLLLLVFIVFYIANVYRHFVGRVDLPP